ncbi:predicted protein [Chaetomium globosum CBS 148.51]|uniref:Uncharacterized protein n=1 Tax=Chaetomium globosum (strain ATCC 6205 / CBS 148.51 / DSM 1962 / NBRC 6347 / NRRL 1970) TaxID=306901 RepID=Q2H6P7_CHAGB|nr:uncharacterized protein CHGG_05668 [Chaetomium globosum CBS 148.51]EAQ89049.1 predicted protein [Chaetomium globosum CBS 148.51]
MASPNYKEDPRPRSPEIVIASPVTSLAESTTTTTPATPAAADLDKPVRILVQTRTDLVPGDKSTYSLARKDAMENLICQHVWQRNFDDHRERAWAYNCEFAWDSVECWFLVDHHGPDPMPPLDPPVVWYKWTGAEFPLPRKVRRRVRSYPFTRIPPEQLLKRRTPRPIPPPREFESRAEEIRVQRARLRNTLACNLGLTEELVRFAKENPGPAEWVRARVPPDAWARVDDDTKVEMM